MTECYLPLRHIKKPAPDVRSRYGPIKRAGGKRNRNELLETSRTSLEAILRDSSNNIMTWHMKSFVCQPTWRRDVTCKPRMVRNSNTQVLMAMACMLSVE